MGIAGFVPKMRERVCAFCGNRFMSPRRSKLTCSRSCYSKRLRRAHPRFAEHVARRSRDPGTIARRFWDKTVPEPNTGCVLWAGGTCAGGYGAFTDNYVSYGAHRFAWQLVHGEIPTGLFVLHKCDTPPCVNPAHLFLGTHLENMLDMLRKTRGSQQKITRREAEVIRDLRGKFLQRELAEIFGVEASTICDIQAGRLWSW